MRMGRGQEEKNVERIFTSNEKSELELTLSIFASSESISTHFEYFSGPKCLTASDMQAQANREGGILANTIPRSKQIKKK